MPSQVSNGLATKAGRHTKALLEAGRHVTVAGKAKIKCQIDQVGGLLLHFKQQLTQALLFAVLVDAHATHGFKHP